MAETFEEALDELMLAWSGEPLDEIITTLKLKVMALEDELADDGPSDE